MLYGAASRERLVSSSQSIAAALKKVKHVASEARRQVLKRRPRAERWLGADERMRRSHQQRQATLFLGSDQRNRMKTMMENRHTAKRSHTHDAIDAWLFFNRCLAFLRSIPT